MVTAAVLGAAVGLGGALVLAMAVLIYYYHAAQRKQLEFDSYYSNKMERETSHLSRHQGHHRHSSANHHHHPYYQHHYRGSSTSSSYKSSTSLQIDGAHGNKRNGSTRSSTSTGSATATATATATGSVASKKHQLFLPLMKTHQVN